jgi:DNA topoisomerase-1
VRSVGSAEVNEYLQAIAGEDFSAKDFRTWHASVLALQTTVRALARNDSAFTLKTMLAGVAQALGNTPAVCRKAYIHPQVLELATLVCGNPPVAAHWLRKARTPAGSGWRKAERQLLGFLRTPSD